jgi:hypothetical protein
LKTGWSLNISDLLQQYGVKIRFIGRKDMLPPDVLEAVDDMERLTSGNKKYIPSSSSVVTVLAKQQWGPERLFSLYIT